MAYLFPLRRGPLGAAKNVIGGWEVTSWFGSRIDPLTGRPGNHGGMDLAHSACFDADMIAMADGVVIQSIDGSLTTQGGRWSRLQADDGSVWGYGHANRYEAAPGVDPLNGGQRRVRAGDVIAHVGSTGGSNGAHLHIAYMRPGQNFYSDPFDLLTEAATAGRFAGGGAADTPTTAVFAPLTPQEDDMPDQFSFPDGTSYVLSISGDSDTGFAWVHIGSPVAQTDGRSEHMLSATIRKLAQGNEQDDALFERHPVLSGPHQRPTHV